MGESPKIAEPLELQGRNHVQAKESLNLGEISFLIGSVRNKQRSLQQIIMGCGNGSKVELGTSGQ